MEQFEYKCSNCGKRNVRNVKCGRIVCDSCNFEFATADMSYPDNSPTLTYPYYPYQPFYPYWTGTVDLPSFPSYPFTYGIYK